MPETAVITPNRGYTLVRKALNASEVWDWFGEYLSLWTDVDADVQSLQDAIDAIGFANPVSITFDYSTPPTVTPQGTIWFNDAEYTLNIETGLGATIQVGQEVFLLYYNNTGVEIPNGRVVRPLGAAEISGHVFPTPQLARADSHETAEGTLSVTTHAIANGALGMTTRFGRVRDTDTSGFSPGDALWLSEITAGMLTNVMPVFPDFAISMGGALNSHASAGEVFITITRDVFNIFNGVFDGSFIETIDFVVDSDGEVVTGSLSNSADPGRNLTMIFSDGLETLDTTPALTVTLTAGTDASPQPNFVYIPNSTKVLTVSTTGWPITEHIRVAQLFIQGAVTTQSDSGALKNQNWNDHIKEEGDNGHMLHLAYAMREKLPAAWKSGCEGTAVVTPNGGAADDVNVTVTGGKIMQLHDQSFSAFDTGTGSEILVSNDSATVNRRTSNLNSELTDALGVSMSTNTFSLVLWGVGNKTGEPDFLMLNLPTASYDVGGPKAPTLDEAIRDIFGYAVYSVPSEFLGTGFLIARFTFSHTTADSGTWVLEATEDLRGKYPNTTAGGGTGGAGVTTFLGLTDTEATYVGNADQVPVVNAGETALEFRELATDITLTGNGTLTPLARAVDIPLDPGDSYGYSDNGISDSSDESANKFRDLTLLRAVTVAAMADLPAAIMVTDKYILVNERGSGDNLRRYDKHTGELLEAYSGAAYWGGHEILVKGQKVYIPTAGLIVEINLEDFTDNSIITATDISEHFSDSGGANNILLNGDIYTVETTSPYRLQVSSRGASVYTVANYALTGITGEMRAVVVDDKEEFFYVADDDTGNVYIRKYDVETRTLQGSSAAMAGAFGRALDIRGRYVVLGVASAFNYINTSTLAVSFDGVTTHTNSASHIREGMLYAATSTVLSTYQLPSQMLATPDFVDDSGGNSSHSCSDLLLADGTEYQWTKRETGESQIKVREMDAQRMSMTVLDVVVDGGTEITNMAVGERYLIAAGTPPNADTVVEKRVDGYHYYGPYPGATLYVIANTQQMIYTSDGWRNAYGGQPNSRAAAYDATLIPTDDVEMSDEGNIIILSHACELAGGGGQYINIPSSFLSLTGGAFRFSIQTIAPFEGYVLVTVNGSTSTYFQLTPDTTGIFSRMWDVAIANGEVVIVGNGTVTEVTA